MCVCVCVCVHVCLFVVVHPCVMLLDFHHDEPSHFSVFSPEKGDSTVGSLALRHRGCILRP